MNRFTFHYGSKDISVIGMDNIDFTNLSRPRLTTTTNDSIEFGNSVMLSGELATLISGRYIAATFAKDTGSS